MNLVPAMQLFTNLEIEAKKRVSTFSISQLMGVFIFMRIIELIYNNKDSLIIYFL